MQFKLKRAATDYDIPLASVYMPDIRASDIIQTYDFSHALAGNPIAAFMWMNTFPDGKNRIPSERYKLVSDNLYGEVLVTDEYFYEERFGTNVPLWYIHPLRQVYYNPNTIDRIIKKAVREDHVLSDRVVTSLIPTNGFYIIVADSVRIAVREIAGGPVIYLDNNDFHVNYAVGSIAVSESAMYTVSGDPIYEFTVEYQLVALDIRVQSAEDILYRFELLPINSLQPGYFTVNILCNHDDQVSVIYRSQKGPGTVVEIQEYTTALPVYTEVTDQARIDILSDPQMDFVSRRVYSRNRTNGINSIYVTRNNPESIFSFKPLRVQANKIMVKEPVVGDYALDWHMRITAGHVKNRSGEYSIESNSDRLCIREMARVITTRYIAVSGKDLIVQVRDDGTWNGVTVTRKIDTSAIPVVSVDSKNGMIGLSQDVSRRDEVMVTYAMRTKDLVFQDICFNPLTHHAHHNGSIREKAIILCMIENSYVPPVKKHPLYYLYLNKYTAGRPATYTYPLIDNWINNTDQSIRNTYRAGMGLPDIFYGTDLIRIEPLAMIQIANPLDRDAYQVEDARVYGGGYRTRQHSFFDYSYYDGEGTDLESMLVIEIPEWIKEDLVQRAQLWDADVILSDVPRQVADYKAMNSIRAEAKKFSMIGTTQEVIIGRKTSGNNP